MTQSAVLDAFLDRYQSAFERFDAAALVELFSYPCQIAGDGEPVSVHVLPSAEAWLPRIQQLLGAYRTIGVRAARRVDVRELALGERLLQATVHWQLLDSVGEPIYAFHAAYTLADLGSGLRIAAIAHNETPLLMAAMHRVRSGPAPQTT